MLMMTSNLLSFAVQARLTLRAKFVQRRFAKTAVLLECAAKKLTVDNGGAACARSCELARSVNFACSLFFIAPKLVEGKKEKPFNFLEKHLYFE